MIALLGLVLVGALAALLFRPLLWLVALIGVCLLLTGPLHWVVGAFAAVLTVLLYGGLVLVGGALLVGLYGVGRWSLARVRSRQDTLAGRR